MTSKISFPIKVEIVGSWSNWVPQSCKVRSFLYTKIIYKYVCTCDKVNKDGLFEADVKLPPGSYEYKFLMNGVWCLDHTKPTTTNEDGVENNLLIVSFQDCSFHLVVHITYFLRLSLLTLLLKLAIIPLMLERTWMIRFLTWNMFQRIQKQWTTL